MTSLSDSGTSVWALSVAILGEVLVAAVFTERFVFDKVCPSQGGLFFYREALQTATRPPLPMSLKLPQFRVFSYRGSLPASHRLLLLCLEIIPLKYFLASPALVRDNLSISQYFPPS